MPNSPAIRNPSATHGHDFSHFLRSGDGLLVAEWLAHLELKSMPVLANGGQFPLLGDVPTTEWKSIYRSAFSHYLRTGQLVTMGEGLARYERKFNPYHDERGRFTFAPGGPKTNGGNRKTKPMSKRDIQQHAAHAVGQYQRELARGKSPAEAAAWAANSEAESGGDPSKHQVGGGPGQGLFQWGSNDRADRRATFQKVMGIPVDQATADQQLDFRDWELRNTEKSASRHIDAAQGVVDKTRAITKYYVRPYDSSGAADDRAQIAQAILDQVGQ